MSSQYKLTKINTCTKRTKILGALLPIAQLVVAKLVCRIVDWRADIFMTEKLDVYVFVANIMDINRRYILPTLLCGDLAHRCK